MNKKTGLRKRLVVMLLTAVIFVSSIGMVMTFRPEKAKAGVVDDLMATKLAQNISAVSPVITGVTGAISLVGSLVGAITTAAQAEKDNPDVNGGCVFWETLIGCNSKEEQMLINIQEDLNLIKADIKTIDGKVDILDEKLNQVVELLHNITKDIKGAVEEIIIQLNQNTMQMQNWTEQFTTINTFYSKYSNLKGTLNNIIDDLRTNYTDYENNLNKAYNLENGAEIKKAVNKITLNYDKSYNTLTEEEKALLDTKISISADKESTVGAILRDYTEQTHTDMVNVYSAFTSDYETNMYDTVTNMGSYITGGMDFLQGGIGENYYKLAIMSKSTSTEVHNEYRNFMARVLYDFMLTSYVCNISLNAQRSYLIAQDNGNTTNIQNFTKKINNIRNLVKQVVSYAEYEYKMCIEKYDYDGFKPDAGYTKDDYVVYYGNPINKAKFDDTNSKTRFTLKRDINPGKPMANATQIVLGSNETYNFKIYYNYKELQSKVKLESSDPHIAIISPSGKITAVSEGSCTVGFRDRSKGYVPLCTVDVNSSLVTKNSTFGTSAPVDRFVSSTETGSIIKEVAGNGYDYNFAETTATTKNLIIKSNKRMAFDLATRLKKDEKEFKENIKVSSLNDKIVIEDNMVYVLCPTNGVVSVKFANDTGKTVILQIPILSNEEKPDTIDTSFLDFDYTSGGGDTTYIYSKTDLINWKNDFDKYHNIVLMKDIDFGYSEWTTMRGFNVKDGTYTHYKFNGNGHTIRNITFKQTKFDADKDKNSYYGLMFEQSGTFERLNIENVKYVDDSAIPADYTRNYFVYSYKTGPKDYISVKPIPDAHFTDCSVSGDINININKDGTVRFAPFTMNPYNNVNRFVYRADTIINLNGKNVILYIGSKTPENFKQSVYTGNIRVTNNNRPDNVVIENFYGYYTPYFNAKSVDSQGTESNILYKDNQTGSKVELSAVNPKQIEMLDEKKISKPDFWTNTERGYDANVYYLNSTSAESVPLFKSEVVLGNQPSHEYKLRVVDNGFKTTYKLGENPDYSHIRIMRGPLDVTRSCKHRLSGDINTVGEKTLKYEYDTQELKITLNYYEMPYRRYVTFTGLGANFDETIVKYYLSGEDYKIDVEYGEKTGYKQVMWETLDGKRQYGTGQIISLKEDLVLKPLWVAQKVNYTEEIYVENINDDEFTLDSTSVKQEYADSDFRPSPVGKVNFTHKPVENVKINPDGSTVVRIYYLRDRFTVTLVFDSEKCDMDNYTLKKEYKYQQSVPTEFTECRPKGHYILNGFDGNYQSVDGNNTYNATYGNIDYTVTYLVNDSEFKTLTGLGYGDELVVETPVIDSDEKYDYKVVGWDNDYTGYCQGNKTYKPVIEKSLREYTLTFPDYVKVTKGETQLKTGDIVHYDDIITLEYIYNMEYKFNSFVVTNSEAKENNQYKVMGNVEISVDRTKIDGVYVNFYNGTELMQKIYVEKGTDAVYTGETPVKAKDSTYTYTFSGWDKTLIAVTEPMDVHAQFSQEYIDYIVIFKDFDGREISRATYHYGDTVKLPEDPTRYNEDGCHKFIGWGEEISVVNGNSEYVAQYEDENTHIMSDWITDVEPTEDKEGHRYKKCTHCGKILVEETIEKLPKKGCGGSIEDGAMIVSILAILSAMLIIIKKKHN